MTRWRLAPLARGAGPPAATVPDMLLLDVRLPVLDGTDAVARIAADPAASGAGIALLPAFGLDEYVAAAVGAGAAGFRLEDVTPERLAEAVRAVAAGDPAAPAVTGRLVDDFARRAPDGRPRSARAVLDDRERAVLRLLPRGLMNDEIAEELDVGVATVTTHLRQGLRKLRAPGRLRLVVATEGGPAAPGER